MLDGNIYPYQARSSNQEIVRRLLARLRAGTRAIGWDIYQLMERYLSHEAREDSPNAPWSWWVQQAFDLSRGYLRGAVKNSPYVTVGQAILKYHVHEADALQMKHRCASFSFLNFALATDGFIHDYFFSFTNKVLWIVRKAALSIRTER